MELSENQELLDEFLASIDCPVIVEGRKDRRVLENLGVKDVVQLNDGRPLYEIVESLQDNKSAVILTDFDRAGKGLRRKLLKLMNLYGISERKKPRELFARMRVGCVEGIL